jgi:hypothetical protein
MTQLDAHRSEETSRSMSWIDRSPYQSLARVVAVSSSSEGSKASSSEGAATTSNEMMGLETDYGGGTKSTSLTKRECYIF